jgi:hypothetical protein
MTDTFATGPNAPGDTTPEQAGDVTGTLAELERKLRELERELTAIGRRRERTSADAAPEAPSSPPAGAPTPLSGRLVDEAIEPPTPIKPPTPPVEPPAPAEPPGSGQPVKFVRPLESARLQASREPARRSEAPAEGEPRTPYKPLEERQPQPAPEPGARPRPSETERPRPSEAQLASLAELRRFRDRLERFARDLAAEYDALLSRVMAGLTSASPPPASRSSTGAAPGSQPAAYVPPASHPSPDIAPAPPLSAPTPPADAPSTEAPASRDETLFEGRVELGVGPFYDLASLSAFERRLANLPHVSEASVRRFEASHAVVDLRLAAPVALVRELRRTAETDFDVREVADGRILLTFDDG